TDGGVAECIGGRNRLSTLIFDNRHLDLGQRGPFAGFGEDLVRQETTRGGWIGRVGQGSNRITRGQGLQVRRHRVRRPWSVLWSTVLRWIGLLPLSARVSAGIGGRAALRRHHHSTA